MAISDIKSTQVAFIPIGIPFYHFGVWLMLYLISWPGRGTWVSYGDYASLGDAWGTETSTAQIWRSQTICRYIAWSISLKLSRDCCMLCIARVHNSQGKRTAIISIPPEWWAMAAAMASVLVMSPAISMTTKVGNSTSHITDVECNGIQTLNQLMHCRMLGLLCGGELGQLDFLMLPCCGCG